MTYEGTHGILSAEEWHYTEQYHEAYRQVDELTAALDHPLRLKIESAAAEMAATALLRAHARLCRLRPDLSDLFCLAIWPEMMSTPEWTTRSGKPFEMAEPASVRQGA